jgi:hypothetical protein
LLIVLAVIVLAAAIWPLIKEIKREDTPRRFAELASITLPDLEAEGALSINPTEAEQQLGLEQLRADLRTLGRECRDLAPIARTMESELGRALALTDAAPGASGILLSGMEAAVGYSLGSSEMLESGSKGLLDLAKNYVGLFQELSAIRTTIEAQRIALFELAPRFSAPPGTEPVLSIRMAEEKPALIDRLLDPTNPHSPRGTQTLTLVNDSGLTLTACVLSIRLVEEKGDTYRHIYSVTSWPAGERRVVKYTPGILFPKTSTDVNRVQVQLYAAEASSPVIELPRKGKAWPYIE